MTGHISHSAFGFTVLLSVTCVLGWSPRALAEQANDQPVTVRKSEEGLHFEVPPDWPIEKRNGVVGPIPIEEYMGRKFQGVERRLQELEKQTTALDLRLRVMEEAMKGAQRRLQSSEPGAAQ